MVTGAGDLARHAVELARDQRFEDLVDLFAPDLRDLVDSTAMAASWKGVAQRYGVVTAVGEAEVEEAGGSHLVRVPLDTERGPAAVLVTVDPEGLLRGLQVIDASPAPG